MRIVAQGWIGAAPDLPAELNGVTIPIETRTRREEYTLAHDLAPEGTTLLDVATGFMPEWHLFSHIMARAGWTVDAIDSDPRVMDLPPHPDITYHHADGQAIPLPSLSYDYVTCISTLEHVSEEERAGILAEMLRCCRPGGRIFISADYGQWLPALFGEDPGGQPPPGFLPTFPPVYFIAVDLET